MSSPSRSEQTDNATNAEQRSVLTRMIRVMFPHPQFPDGPYERTADIIIADAEQANWSKVVLQQGLTALRQLAGGDFLDLDETAATGVLKRIESTEFFNLVRRTAVVKLYDDDEVWESLGYEGPSFDKGGYIDRGFDDLDWLPDPRIESYDGPEPLVEVAPAVQLSAAATAGQAQDRDTSGAPGRAETQMTEVGK